MPECVCLCAGVWSMCSRNSNGCNDDKKNTHTHKITQPNIFAWILQLNVKDIHRIFIFACKMRSSYFGNGLESATNLVNIFTLRISVVLF